MATSTSQLNFFESEASVSLHGAVAGKPAHAIDERQAQRSEGQTPKPHAKPDDDVCRRKHGGNPNSEAANERVAPFKVSIRERVRTQIAATAEYGCTINELQIWDASKKPPRMKYPNELSPRLKELRDDHQIFDSLREREDCTVYVAERKWVNGSAEEGQ